MTRFLTALIALTIAGLVFVYTEVEAVKVGYVIRKQEENKVLLIDRSRQLKYNIARLKAPGTLEKRLVAQRVVLQSPKVWQTIMVRDGMRVADPASIRPPLNQGLALAKLFIGTAQAEAKEPKAR